MRRPRLRARDAHLPQLAGARIAPRREVALKAYLARQGLPNVTVTLERDLPARRDPRTGKLRQVCVECTEPRTAH